MRKETSTNFQNEQEISEACPFNRVLTVLGNRWRSVILWKLLAGACRFSQLQRDIPTITEKMLAQELRTLEQSGLICRHIISQRPPHVEYEVTSRGSSLHSVLQQMFEWGEKFPDRWEAS